ncbi:hypothetical protein NQZ68_002068 [Dissostichus eleginoides]|nr:hypothetical protein NQZ68_002068 [Dissostichus eleginoides]
MCAEMKRIYIQRGDGQSGGTGFLIPAETHHSGSQTLKVPAQTIMEAAICTFVSQFKAYAGKDGASSTLSREEFHNLVTAQLPNYVKNASDPGAIDQLMGSLDENNDGELTFLEFWQLIGTLANKQGGFTD